MVSHGSIQQDKHVSKLSTKWRHKTQPTYENLVYLITEGSKVQSID